MSSTITPLYFYLITAVVLIATELLVFQFTIFWFLFVGLGALVTSVVIMLLSTENWILSTGIFVVSSSLMTYIFHRPLLNWQRKSGELKGNTTLGQKVTITETITTDTAGKVRWSGAEWQAELAKGETVALIPGQKAEIVAVSGIRLIVKPELPNSAIKETPLNH